jgi:hypothetical protein
MCQHSSIPFNDSDGTHLKPEEIYEGAVHDLYHFCLTNNLCQVWSYMWNCWYEPEKWKLWARSAFHSIPTIRTTMIVESFWKSFKHGTLSRFSNPRVDLVTHLILTHVIGRIHFKLGYLLGDLRQGRPKPLAPWQKSLKQQWEDLSCSDEHRRAKKELSLLRSKPSSASGKKLRTQRLDWIREESEGSSSQYKTSLTNWTCSCPSYLLSRFLVCKHLVRSANQQLGKSNHGLRFFARLHRHHEVPFYRIPGIHSIENPEPCEDIPIIEGSDSDQSSDDGSDNESDNNLKSLRSDQSLRLVDDQRSDRSLRLVDDLQSEQSLRLADEYSSQGFGDDLEEVGFIDGNSRVCIPFILFIETTTTNMYCQAFTTAEELEEFDAKISTVRGLLTRSTGLHPKMKKRIFSTTQSMYQFVDDVEETWRHRKRRKTWADPNINTRYLDVHRP